jgi:uncharacterized protein
MSGRRVREDHGEYRDLIKDKVKSRVKDHIKTGKKVKRHGKDLVVVDIPVIDLPSFRHGRPKTGGIGNGPAEIGDEVGDGPPQPGEGEGAGDQEAEHTMGVGVNVSDYIDVLGEELELPHLVPKLRGDITNPKVKYNGLSRVGNNCLLHKKKTLKNAMKRVISTGNFNPDDISNVYPVQQDKVYKTWNVIDSPDINAVVFFLQDISWSMDGEKRELVRELCWYLEQWIRKFYKQVDLKHIVHDVIAQEVDQEKFYSFEAGGGTKISSAFELTSNIIDSSYPSEDWNMYVFYFSDGENWGEDTSKCVSILEQLQLKCNLIGIGEVKGNKQWSDFALKIEEQINDNVLDQGVVTTCSIDSHDDILISIKEFLSPVAAP